MFFRTAVYRALCAFSQEQAEGLVQASQPRELLQMTFSVLENAALSDRILHTTEKSQKGGITEYYVNAAVPLMNSGRLLQESCRQLAPTRDRGGL